MESTPKSNRSLDPAVAGRRRGEGPRARASETAAQLRLFDTTAAVPPRVGVVLAGWGLVMAAEMTLVCWQPVVVEALRVRYGRNERTAAKVIVEAVRLFKYLAAVGAVRWDDVTEQLVVQWCWAASRDRSGRHRRAAQSTARNRQWAALAAFGAAAELGAPIDPKALVGERIPRPSRSASARPLVFAEAEAVRVHADAGLVASRRSVMVALSFAGGTATEVAAVRCCDVDTAAARVWFCGDAARWGPLDGWSAATLGRFFANNPPLQSDERLCVTDRLDAARAAHSVTVQLGQVLQAAGLAGRPGVTARSIRLTTARRILDTDGIEAAARFLGSASLDTTADALGHLWRPGDG